MWINFQDRTISFLVQPTLLICCGLFEVQPEEVNMLNVFYQPIESPRRFKEFNAP